jgi:hypothetical protein
VGLWAPLEGHLLLQEYYQLVAVVVLPTLEMVAMALLVVAVLDIKKLVAVAYLDKDLMREVLVPLAVAQLPLVEEGLVA